MKFTKTIMYASFFIFYSTLAQDKKVNFELSIGATIYLPKEQCFNPYKTTFNF